VSVFGIRVQPNFDKRDSLERDQAYKRENFYALCLVSQAECATLSGSFTRVFSLPHIEARRQETDL
jgi:hypothetical protein